MLFIFFKLVLAAIILITNLELPPCGLSMHPLPSKGVAELQPRGSPGSITLGCCLQGLHRQLRSSSMGAEKKSSLGMDVTWQGSAKPAAAGIKTLLAHEEAVWLLYSRLGPHFGLLQLCREVRCGRRAARLGGSRMQRRGVAACAGGAVPRSHFCSGTEENPRLCFAAHLAVAPASSQPHALKQGLSSVRLQL